MRYDVPGDLRILPWHRQSGTHPILALMVTVAFASFSMSGPAHAVIDCEGTTPIYEIQGEGHISPLVDQVVETCGVVTAVGFNFYFLQDALGDGNDDTADGLYVFTTSEKPSVGVEIRIAGEVAEFIPGGEATGNLSITQMAFPDIIDSAPANVMPTPVVLGSSGRTPPAEIVISDDELPVNLQNVDDDTANLYDPDEDAIDFYESLEGMLVTIQDAVAISAIRQFGSFSAEVWTLADNGGGVIPDDARTSNGGIQLQADPNNAGDQNPERIQVQFDGTVYQGGDYPYIQVGDRLGDVTGPVGYSFGNFEVYATDELSPVRSDISPEEVPGNASSVLTVASYNVLNLSAVSDDTDQMLKIASQIVDNLQSPDIIALQEIQDNNGDVGNCDDDIADCAEVLDASDTLQALADAVSSTGGPNYAFFNVDPLIETTDDNRDDPNTFGGVSLGNIRNAFLYNPERVDLIDFVGLTREELDARGVKVSTAFDGSRDPLEATFEFDSTEIIVINNHFSSRFGSTPIFGGPQPFVQAAEDAREAQSLAMHQLVKQYVSINPQANVIVLGDLNTFEFTNDLAEILTSAEVDGLLTRIRDSDAANQEYSFIFEGNSQALDHIYATEDIASDAVVDYVHVNVDFPRRFEDVVSSDHEPLLASFNFSDLPSLNLRGSVYSPSALELFWDRQPGAVEYQIIQNATEVASLDAISYFVEGLLPATRFDYTVNALNVSGDIIGMQMITLVTNDGVPLNNTMGLLRDLSFAVYSSSAIELFWNADRVEFPNVLTFRIYRDNELLGENDGRSFFEEGLMQGTSYEYTVEYLLNGIPAQSETVTVTTNGTGPSTPSFTVSGEVYSSSALELFWMRSREEAAVYRIERNGAIVDTRDARSFFDSGLDAATTYNYTISELNVSGDVLASSTITLVTRD